MMSMLLNGIDDFWNWKPIIFTRLEAFLPFSKLNWEKAKMLLNGKFLNPKFEYPCFNYLLG